MNDYPFFTRPGTEASCFSTGRVRQRRRCRRRCLRIRNGASRRARKTPNYVSRWSTSPTCTATTFRRPKRRCCCLASTYGPAGRWPRRRRPSRYQAGPSGGAGWRKPLKNGPNPSASTCRHRLSKTTGSAGTPQPPPLQQQQSTPTCAGGRNRRSATPIRRPGSWSWRWDWTPTIATSRSPAASSSTLAGRDRRACCSAAKLCTWRWHRAGRCSGRLPFLTSSKSRYWT